MNRESLTIGRLARKAGVNLETVRYYERRGLQRVLENDPHLLSLTQEKRLPNI